MPVWYLSELTKTKVKTDLLRTAILVIHSLFVFFPGFSQGYRPYKDPALPVELRVQDLLSRMTEVEKFRQLFMIPGDMTIGKENLESGLFGLQVSAKGTKSDAAGQMLTYGDSGTVGQHAMKINELQKFFKEESRLGIPIIPFEEALHGLVCKGATIFPQAIGLAASFDIDLMHQVAGAIAAEARSRGIRQLLSPVLNIARDVRWGRTEETYGEDPWLVSQMGLAYISEIEKAGIVATPKHFAVNSGEGGRDSHPVHYNERLMEEVYFPAFKTAIGSGNAQSVMTAYNSFDGSPCSANNWLLNKKLKQEWSFRGFVISDACAVGGANVLHYTAADYDEAGKQAVENGLDVIFQTDFSHLSLFSGPFIQGTVRHGAVDSAVSRVLHAKFSLGLFEDPYTNPESANRLNNAKEHRELALKAAREAIVLLKNENKILPVSPNVRTIAIIGTDATEARLGGYSGPGSDKISILEGVRQTAPENLAIVYSPGCGRNHPTHLTVPPENLCHDSANETLPGLQAAYFNNITLEGEPLIIRTDVAIDFGWTLYGPDPALPNDWYSASWTGKIIGNSTGTYKIGIEGNDGYRLYLDGKQIIDNWVKKSYGVKLADFEFFKGREYDIKLEYFESTGKARLKLVWDAGFTDTTDLAIVRAVEACRTADLVIVVAGIEEGEFRDRSSLALPGRQEEMILAIASTGKPMVVVITGGSAVTMNQWISKAGGIVDVWYPGEAGGIAVADILFGKYNPAGRLPITFPITEGQLPLVYNQKPTGRGNDYNDLSGMALFPFGFGLSYSTFEYGNLRFHNETIHLGDSVVVQFTLKNTSSIIGDEVYQVYIRDVLSSVARPEMELKGFGRVTLNAGETREVSITLPPDCLSMPDVNLKPVVEPGRFRVMVGASSEDIRLRGVLNVK